MAVDANQLFRQAAALHSAGQLDEAERLYRSVMKSYPRNADVKRLLGRLLIDAGRCSEGLPLVRKAAAANPREVRYQVFLAQALADAGRADEAIRQWEKVLKQEPANAEHVAELGKLYFQLVRMEEAIDCFERAHQLDEHNTEYRYLIGAARLRSGEIPADTSHFEYLIEVDPSNTVWRTSLGFALWRNNDFEKAEQHFRAVLEAEPDNDQAIGGLAQTLESTGRTDEAHSLLQRALERDLRTHAVVMAYARVCKRQKQQAEALPVLEAYVERHDITPFDRMSALFKLGDLYEDLGEYDRAWDTYRRANETQPLRWNRQEHRKYVESIIRAYNPETVPTLDRGSNQSSLPVFVVGMFRSGTSLTDQILCCHPQIRGAGELLDIHNLAVTLHRRRGESQPYPKCVKRIESAWLDEFADGFLGKLNKLVDDDAVRIVTDKNPMNYLHLGFIWQMLPGARIIHVQRNPLDTCVSCYANSFTGAHAYTQNQSDLAATYVECVRLMDHWKSFLEIPIFTVNYEELVQDQERITREMLDFLGLPWDDACLKFYESKRVLQTLSVDQIRRPMYTCSIERHKRFEKHLDELKRGLAPVLGTGSM